MIRGRLVGGLFKRNLEQQNPEEELGDVSRYRCKSLSPGQLDQIGLEQHPQRFRDRLRPPLADEGDAHLRFDQ